ncbi:MAG: hypothetical protein ACUVT9_05395 [Candidatus Bathycorpusculaceae bacterium]
MSEKAWGKIQVTLKGLTPLLMNKLTHETLHTKSRRRLDQPNFETQAETSAYIDIIDGKRQLYIPNYAVYAMIVNTATQWKTKRTSLSNLLAGTIHIEPEKIPLGTDKYEVDVRPVVIQRSRVLKARAKISEWQITFTIIYNKRFLPEGITETLRAIIEDAGMRVGLLDYRPQHKGWFGTFEVVECKVLQ